MNFKEPSSWGGIGVILATGIALIPNDFTAFGIGHSEWQVVLGGAAVICGAVAVWCKEKGNKGDNTNDE